jgi:hypothetical protein
MNAKDFQLTELNYDRTSILMRAIYASYQVYTQLNIVGPIGHDLQEATRRLVVSLLWINTLENKLVAELVGRICGVIERCCENKGEGYSYRFRDELYQWVREVETEYATLTKNL